MISSLVRFSFLVYRRKVNLDYVEMAIGSLGIMKWLHENGVQWSKKTFQLGAEYGNLENMEWLHNNEFPWSEDTF